MYNYIYVDGKSFLDMFPDGVQMTITPGQVMFMINEIDKQKGKEHNRGNMYWDEDVGSIVK